MQFTTLGRSGLKVSRLILGTMNFGMVTDESDACGIMDGALDAGIKVFDTAVVTAPIVGPRTVEQLTDRSTDVLARLDAIWPGPGGEAPKAYAW